MKDIELTVTVRNNQLKERRLLAGLTQEEFSIRCGINHDLYGKLECLQTSPFDSRDQWKEIALQIARHHNVPPDKLWPPETCAIKKNKSVRVLDAVDMARLVGACEQPALGPIEVVERSEQRKIVSKVLGQLSPVEQEVLGLRFGLDGSPELTLDEVGKRIGKSQERTRQIEFCALSKLRRAGKKRLGPFDE
jgi:RNA polymerase sigma factor (sigma-70 family)